jgi:type VI secretion system secreted protein Hcp
MAFDAFMKIDGIPGESTDDKHKDWIEILSYSWGASQPASPSRSAGGAASAARVNVQDLSIVHALDKASPKLFLACCKGDHIKEVTLELCRATGDKQKYMQYKLTDVLVSSVHPGGSSKGSDVLPLEEVAFNYGKIDMTYTVIDPAGKAKGDVKANWDLTANKGG